MRKTVEIKIPNDTSNYMFGLHELELGIKKMKSPDEFVLRDSAVVLFKSGDKQKVVDDFKNMMEESGIPELNKSHSVIGSLRTVKHPCWVRIDEEIDSISLAKINELVAYMATSRTSQTSFLITANINHPKILENADLIIEKNNETLEKQPDNQTEEKMFISEGTASEVPADAINPSHYRQYPLESIEMMERIWGTQKVIDFCIMNAFKYRMRLGHKDNVEQEMKKEKWYLDKAHELKQKLE